VVSRAREREEGRRIEPPAVAASALESLEGGWLDLTAGRCLDIADGLRNYHSDAEIARALGFPAVVVQGVFNCNLVSALMTERFGAGWYCGGQMRLSLVNVLWEGDRARARVALEQMEDERPRRRVRGQAWVEKVDGTITAIGAVSALIPGA
jgi:acyl dehydratase